MKITSCLVHITALMVGAAVAQPAAEDSPEKAAVVALAREYEAAFAKADAATLASYFAEDAEQTTEDGTLLSGRAEIEKAIRAGLSSNPGAKLEIAVDSVRLLSPDVAVEKGQSMVTAKDGEASGSLYTAIHVKKDGKWKISQLTETALTAVTPRERLAELEWLVGDWTEKDGETSIASAFNWARGGNFLTRNVIVKSGGETTLEGWQIIAWDASQERIRSWTFDTEGGFSEGVWTRNGDSWLIRESGVAADGSRTTADQTIRKSGDDKFTWEANNRTLDGEPQPGIGRFEITRMGGN